MVNQGSNEVSRWIAFIVSLLGGIIAVVILIIPVQALILEKVSALSLTALTIGFSEEAFKPLGLAIVGRANPDWLPTKRDYMIGGSLAGIGFAFLENLLYYLREGSEVLIYRSIAGLTFHMATSAFVGAGIYFYIRERNPYKFVWLLGFAIVIHALYNFIVFSITSSPT